jgi:hypothetical protein
VIKLTPEEQLYPENFGTFLGTKDYFHGLGIYSQSIVILHYLGVFLYQSRTRFPGRWVINFILILMFSM